MDVDGSATPPDGLTPALCRSLARAVGRFAAGSGSAAERQAVARAAADLGAGQWPAVPAWAEAAGVGPAAAASLGGLAPARVAAALADLASRTVARGRRLAEERAVVAAALSSAGIPYRPLKGAWSAPLAWSPPAARPMADTDLFVPPALLPAAQSALEGLGYRPLARTWKHRAFARPAERVVVDARGEHPDNPRPIEVHASFGEALRGIAWPGPAAGPFDDAARDAAALAHALGHASVDILERRLRLVTLVDIARLAVVLDPATWHRALASMSHPRAARFAWPALALAERELGAVLPEGGAGLAFAVHPALLRWLDAADLHTVSRAGRAEAVRGILPLAGIWPLDRRERLAMWRHALVPGRWHLADRYPRLASSPAWPLAYALHAAFSLRLAAVRGGQALRRAPRRTRARPSER